MYPRQKPATIAAPAQTGGSKRLGLVIVLAAVGIAAAALYRFSRHEAPVTIPPGDRLLPTSEQILESDRPDLLEEPAFRRTEDEPEEPDQR